MDTVTVKINHLRRHFDFTDGELADIAKMYAGEDYPRDSEGIRKLRAISLDLCERYDMAFANKKKAGMSKGKILKLLFPLLPAFPGLIRRGMRLVIGMVDIEDNAFINVGANFGVSTLVHLAAWAQLGPNFSVEEEDQGPAKKIEVLHDAWLGGKVKAKAGVTVGADSTVGSGAYVNADLPEASLAIGKPARILRQITAEEPFHDGDFHPYSDEELDLIRNHYKKAHHSINRKQFNAIFTGHAFSTLSLPLDFLYLFTQGLCAELDDPDIAPERRNEIIDLLFPIHGKNINIGKNFFLDLAGTVSLGDDVTIGDNVALGGLVRIGNGVHIGNGCLLFGSNHPTSAKKRKVGFNEGLGLSIPVAYVPITIEDGTHLGDDVCVAPKAKIGGEVPAGSLVDPKGKIIP